MRGWLLGTPAGIGLATPSLHPQALALLSSLPERRLVRGQRPCNACRHPWRCVRTRARTACARTREAFHARDAYRPESGGSALAVALAAHAAATAENVEELPARFHALVSAYLDLEHAAELIDLIDRAIRSAASLEETDAFVRSLGLERGVTGYMYHTVPARVARAGCGTLATSAPPSWALAACGGDTDTTGAITGSIVGAGVGRAGLPEDWLANLWEAPCSAAWIEPRRSTTKRTPVEHHQPPTAVPTNVPLLLLRNGLFACIVLTHGFRRLLPPYG